MMIFSLVAMIGLEKCCITSACLQWLCHSGERTVAFGPLVKLVSLCVGISTHNFFTKSYVVGIHSKRLCEILYMSTHNICFLGEMRKYITTSL